MVNPLKNFGNSAKELSRNPLGIIALFIVLVYGFACLLFGFSSAHLGTNERLPLIWFTVIFPLIVLFMFFRLVTKHHDKLYGPGDYREDESFLKTLQQSRDKSSKTIGSKKDIEDLMSYGKEFKTIEEQENRIRSDRRLNDLDLSTDTAKVLIHHLAASQVLSWFEKVFNTLFGSQIRLLRLLDKESSGIPEGVALTLFMEAKLKYPETLGPWVLNDYLKFLIASSLIIQRDKIITITNPGKEFLIWLTRSGYSESKIL